MAVKGDSTKKRQISKVNSMVVVVVAIAGFVSVSCVMASRTLLSQQGYQAKIISEKEKAKKQIDSNVAAVSSLEAAYKEFAGSSQNLLGGSATGQGALDGDNAKLVLDALPSKYDFPALGTSLEKLLKDKGATIESITGVDDEVAQQTAADGQPGVIEIPFELTASGQYTVLQDVVRVFDTASIRPFQIVSLSISAQQTDLQMALSAKTFYQPERSLGITKKVVK